MELKDNSSLNFLIGVHFDYGEVLTGGVVAMHRLAYKLAERCQNVYIFAKPEYPHENIIQIPSKNYHENGLHHYTWDEFKFPLGKTISVLSEIARENPYNTKHVARWILYDTEFEIENTWSQDDEYFNFSDFKVHKEKQQRPLKVFDYKLDKLYNTNQVRSKKYCHILHKNTPENHQEILSKFNSEDIISWKTKGGWDYLREVFNQYEYFLTFDRKTFYTTAAALCGCKVIILNVEGTNITPEEYRNENEIQRVGIAWGEQDLLWAEKTIDFVRDHIVSLEKMDDRTVDNFLQFWKNKINTQK